MYSTLRKSDHSTEEEVAKFLDKYYYPVYTSNARRITDLQTQLKGIDVVCDLRLPLMENLRIDEKTQGHYINKNLPTFAFEVNFKIQSNQLVQGWLYDQKKETDCYLLTWITAKKDRNIVLEDIISLYAIMIERAAILKILNGSGYDEGRIMKEVEQMRRGSDNKKILEGTNDFYLFYTTHLVERPINIVIRKHVLEANAIWKGNLEGKTDA